MIFIFFLKDFISRVYIRDDGSVDQTINIIKKYIELYPDLILLVEDKKGNLGPRDSFFTLCEYATENFIAFCDQDDVWKSTKLKEFAIFIHNNVIDGENEKAPGPTHDHSLHKLIKSRSVERLQVRF